MTPFPYPSFITICLVATAAIVAAAAGGYVLLAVIPLAAAGLACLAGRFATRPKPPKLAELADVRVWLSIDVGSMDQAAEAAWRARYQVPPVYEGDWVSGACADRDEGGFGPAPWRPPGLPAYDLEQLERLANTAEMRKLS